MTPTVERVIHDDDTHTIALTLPVLLPALVAALGRHEARGTLTAVAGTPGEPSREGALRILAGDPAVAAALTVSLSPDEATMLAHELHEAADVARCDCGRIIDGAGLGPQCGLCTEAAEMCGVLR